MILTRVENLACAIMQYDLCLDLMRPMPACLIPISKQASVGRVACCKVLGEDGITVTILSC